MSREYAMSRVRDALEKSDGNHLKAQRLLMQWLEKDHSLLFGLVGPHLPSIISHAVSHAGQGKEAAKPATKAAPPAAKKAAAPKEKNEFGNAMFQSMRGETADFGQPDGMVPRPGAASQKHIDTLKALAAAQKTRGSSGDKKKK